MHNRIWPLLAPLLLAAPTNAEQLIEFEQMNFSISIPERWKIEHRLLEIVAEDGDLLVARHKRQKSMLTCEYTPIPPQVLPSSAFEMEALLKIWIRSLVDGHLKHGGPATVSGPDIDVAAPVPFAQAVLADTGKKRDESYVYRAFPRDEHMVVCAAHQRGGAVDWQEATLATIKPLRTEGTDQVKEAEPPLSP